MSRKRKRSTNNMENQNSQMSSTSDISSTAKESLNSVASTVNNNKALIGSIAGACGAAIFLLATESGRSIRSGIQSRAVDLYDYVSDQVSTGMDKVRDLTQNMRGSSQVEHASQRTRRAA
jgi:hypothetical protein